MDPYAHRFYKTAEVVSFLKTNEENGEFSNMCAGYDFLVNGYYVRTCEHIYQAMRFPDQVEVQKLILQQASPMTAKLKGREALARGLGREDWQEVKLNTMRWALRLKLAYNYEVFGNRLRLTGDKPIVEISYKDQYWGAKPLYNDKSILQGTNILGRLLMELRRDLINDPELMKVVSPPPIKNFLFYGEPVRIANPKQPEPNTFL